MKKKKKSFGRKINRTVVFVQFAVTAIVAAVTVYKMIPKADKIKGVDTDVLIDSCTYNDEIDAVEPIEAPFVEVEG